jgi:type VI protein secretion system component VasA
VSHTWMQSEDVMERGKVAGRPLWVQTRLEKEDGENEKEMEKEQNEKQEKEKREKEPSTHEISWLGLVQAATAAEALGCEYLWLDLLCLNQVDLEDRRKQIANMHRIFANAAAVVVMLGGLSAAQRVDCVSTCE